MDTYTPKPTCRKCGCSRTTAKHSGMAGYPENKADMIHVKCDTCGWSWRCLSLDNPEQPTEATEPPSPTQGLRIERYTHLIEGCDDEYLRIVDSNGVHICYMARQFTPPHRKAHGNAARALRYAGMFISAANGRKAARDALLYAAGIMRTTKGMVGPLDAAIGKTVTAAEALAS